jgi:hypothetical protein
MKRGIFTGALVQTELHRYGTDQGLSIDLGPTADQILTGMRIRTLSTEQIAQIRSDGLRWTRAWQERFPPDDAELDWTQVTSLLKPEHDLFVRRPGRFAVRIRPDNVAAVGSTLVAVEWSTARTPDSISPARFALNHHALIRERLRRPEWEAFETVVTHVEMLALGYSYTVQLDVDQAERWRISIGNVAEALLQEQYETNPGPHCSTCPWQPPCWFAEDEPEKTF